ncbi:ParB N-terminal domain-containing protein, partial [Zhenhengia yiwuensis]|uniref:ParB N-terminal domain-containing protein n=1 Tax=Zhenhengia yiwuensis TaxID=2763666 RepID=UPI002A750C8B
MCAKVNLFNDENVEYLPIEQLDNFENHPFKLYTEERLEAMKKSIQDYGIITPIIVRVKKMTGRYEILSGHNRVNAARLVGLKEVPA